MLAAKGVMKVCDACGVLMTTQVRASDPGSRKALERWEKSMEKTIFPRGGTFHKSLDLGPDRPLGD